MVWDILKGRALLWLPLCGMRAQERTGMRGPSSSCLGHWGWSGAKKKIKVCVTVHWVCRDMNHSVLFLCALNPTGASLKTNRPLQTNKQHQKQQRLLASSTVTLFIFTFVSLLTTGLSTKISLLWLSDTHLTTNLVSVYNSKCPPRFIST